MIEAHSSPEWFFLWNSCFTLFLICVVPRNEKEWVFVQILSLRTWALYDSCFGVFLEELLPRNPNICRSNETHWHKYFIVRRFTNPYRDSILFFYVAHLYSFLPKISVRQSNHRDVFANSNEIWFLEFSCVCNNGGVCLMYRNSMGITLKCRKCKGRSF